MDHDQIFAENLRSSLRHIEKYLLTATASSVVFVVFSFAVQPGAKAVRWQLLGFPMELELPVALVFLYAIYVVSAWLADHTILHIRDLALAIDDASTRNAILAYPSVITIGPIGQILTTIAPALLVVVGVVRLHLNGILHLPWIVKLLVYSLTTAGIAVYAHTLLVVGSRMTLDSGGRWLRKTSADAEGKGAG